MPYRRPSKPFPDFEPRRCRPLVSETPLAEPLACWQTSVPPFQPAASPQPARMALLTPWVQMIPAFQVLQEPQLTLWLSAQLRPQASPLEHPKLADHRPLLSLKTKAHNVPSPLPLATPSLTPTKRNLPSDSHPAWPFAVARASGSASTGAGLSFGALIPEGAEGIG